MARKTRSITLDDFDRRILALVQIDNQSPLRVIADKVGLSAPAVARRLQQLRAVGVIRQDVSIIDEAAVGRPLTIIAEVTLENERFDLVDAMKRRFLDCRQITQCYYVTGEMDFILVMNVRDMEEYTALTRALFFEGGNVKSFRTCVSMSNIRTNGPIPIDRHGEDAARSATGGRQ